MVTPPPASGIATDGVRWRGITTIGYVSTPGGLPNELESPYAPNPCNSV